MVMQSMKFRNYSAASATAETCNQPRTNLRWILSLRPIITTNYKKAFFSYRIYNISSLHLSLHHYYINCLIVSTNFLDHYSLISKLHQNYYSIRPSHF